MSSVEKVQLVLRRSSCPVIFGVHGIGDHLLSLPAMRAMCQLFHGKLTVVCFDSYALSIWDELDINRLVHYTYTDETVWEFDANELAGRVGPCDLFISMFTCQLESITRLMTLLKPRSSIGFFPDHYTHPCTTDWRAANYVDGVFAISQVIDCDLRLEQFAYPPRFGFEYASDACELFKIIPSGYKVLALHGDSKLDKTWTSDQVASFVNIFLSRHQDFVILALGQSGSFIDSVYYKDHILPCHALPLALQFQLLQRSDAFVGVDSCMLHGADFYRLPSVGLFGPTDSKVWGFRLSPHRYIEGCGSMDNIRINAVVAALEDILCQQKIICSGPVPPLLQIQGPYYQGKTGEAWGIQTGRILEKIDKQYAIQDESNGVNEEHSGCQQVF